MTISSFFAITEDAAYAVGSATKRGMQGAKNLAKYTSFHRKNADNANILYEMGRKRVEDKTVISRGKVGTVADELSDASNVKQKSSAQASRN